MPDEPTKPGNPADDDFLRSFGGLLDDPFEEETPDAKTSKKKLFGKPTSDIPMDHTEGSARR